MDNLLIILSGIIFFIFLPLGELLRVDLPNNVAFTAIDIGVFVFVLLGIIQFVIKRQSISDPLVKPILLFCAACVISLIANISVLTMQEVGVALLYFLRWLLYAGVCVVIGSNRRLQTYLPRMLIISGMIAVGIGYVQFFLYPNLRNLAYLGWDVHLYRMFGGFLDPNFFGAFLVLYVLFVLGFVWKRIPYITRENKIVKIKTGLLLLAGLATLPAIFLTYSRSAYLMLVVGLIVFFVINGRKKVLLWILLILLVGGISLLGFSRKSEGTNLLRITSTEARVNSGGNALTIFERNPILGVGFDAYRYAQRRYGFITSQTQYVDHAGAGTDNSWLFVLATTGIVGLIAYINLWANVLLNASGKKRNIVQLLYCYIVKKKDDEIILARKRGPFSLVVISSSIALFINALFINSLFYSFLMLWMWTIIGIREKNGSS